MSQTANESLIRIRSVKQYSNDFLVPELKENSNIRPDDLLRIKQQMLDAFRREIFEQIADKIGPEAATMSRDDLAGLEKVNNILTQSFRKWRRICILCSEWGFGNYFQLSDLKTVLDDPDEATDQLLTIPADEGEDVTEELKGTSLDIHLLDETGGN